MKEVKEMKEVFKELTEDNKQVILMIAQGMALAQKEVKSC